MDFKKVIEIVDAAVSLAVAVTAKIAVVRGRWNREKNAQREEKIYPFETVFPRLENMKITIPSL